MDSISYLLMRSFIRRHLRRSRGLSVCDVGSCDVSKDGSGITFRQLFRRHKYVGLDIVAGPNVDIVSKDLYRYPFNDETFDAVVSGSTVEHVKDIYKWILELKRITKKNGLICVIGPSHFRLHHPHPVDCWRIMPEGMKFLLGEVAGLEILKIRRSRSRGRNVICMGIGRRND